MNEEQRAERAAKVPTIIDYLRRGRTVLLKKKIPTAGESRIVLKRRGNGRYIVYTSNSPTWRTVPEDGIEEILRQYYVEDMYECVVRIYKFIGIISAEAAGLDPKKWYYEFETPPDWLKKLFKKRKEREKKYGNTTMPHV